MHTITARLEDGLDERIRQFWAERGEGPSSGMRRVARGAGHAASTRPLLRDEAAGPS